MYEDIHKTSNGASWQLISEKADFVSDYTDCHAGQIGRLDASTLVFEDRIWLLGGSLPSTNYAA